MSPRLTVGIMGAGRMAQGYDAPGEARLLTLAHAVSESPAFELRGFFDIDPARTHAAERKWSCRPSPRDRSVWLHEPWDVVCIATPDPEHARDLRDVLGRKPHGILVEKPLSARPGEGLALLREAQRLGVAVLVNFPRRWHTGVAAVGQHIEAGRLGRPRSASFVFSGGAAAAATHMLDLFHTWWGGGWEPALEWSRGRGAAVTLRRAGEAVAASFTSLPPGSYYVWEMHVYCDRGKVQLAASPEILEASVPAPHPFYSAHQVLTPLARFAMEDEPLLRRAFEMLREMIADPDVARAHLERELDSETFTAGVLRCLPGGGA